MISICYLSVSWLCSLIHFTILTIFLMTGLTEMSKV